MNNSHVGRKWSVRVGAARVPSHSVYVGNLPADATAKALKGALGRVLGPTVRMHKVRLLPARDARCAAFVDFAKLAGSAARARPFSVQTFLCPPASPSASLSHHPHSDATITISHHILQAFLVILA